MPDSATLIYTAAEVDAICDAAYDGDGVWSCAFCVKSYKTKGSYWSHLNTNGHERKSNLLPLPARAISLAALSATQRVWVCGHCVSTHGKSVKTYRSRDSYWGHYLSKTHQGVRKNYGRCDSDSSEESGDEGDPKKARLDLDYLITRLAEVREADLKATASVNLCEKRCEKYVKRLNRYKELLQTNRATQKTTLTLLLKARRSVVREKAARHVCAEECAGAKVTLSPCGHEVCEGLKEIVKSERLCTTCHRPALGFETRI